MQMVTGVSDLGLIETCRLDLCVCTMCWDRMRGVRLMASVRSPVWTAVSPWMIHFTRRISSFGVPSYISVKDP